MNRIESKLFPIELPNLLVEFKHQMEKISDFICQNRLRILQINIGIIYLWFGGLKFFSGISPAETLAVDTLTILSAGLISSNLCLWSLALGETVIGFMLVFNVKKRYVIMAALLHLIGTFSPMLIMPDEVFNSGFFSLSLTGQYIVKNLIIFSALIVLYPVGEKA